MDITKMKDKKPWYIPKWLWNQAVDMACDAAKENLKISKVSSFIGDIALKSLEKAIEGKDDKIVETVCVSVANGGSVFSKAAAAARDKVITDEEKQEFNTALTEALEALIPQSAINAKIEDIHDALSFD